MKRCSSTATGAEQNELHNPGARKRRLLPSGPLQNISRLSVFVTLDRPHATPLRLDSSSVAPDLRIYLRCESNVRRAVFQMFETCSTPLWPRSDGSKLGSDPPIFSWLSWMKKSSEDNIAVWPGAADSSIWDPSIN